MLHEIELFPPLSVLYKLLYATFCLQQMLHSVCWALHSLLFIDHYSIPTITPTETSTWALKNESRSLSFNISNGVPSITSNHVWWYFEPLTGKGRYLDPNTTTKYIFSSDHLSINVTGSELSDSGNYTLTVRNEVGLANSTIAFNVYSK